jgi:cytoskeleton-associated protein 5
MIWLDAALAFVDSAVSGLCAPYYDKLFANIVDKTFSGRASTLAKGKALMHKMIEVDDATVCTAFLLTKLTDKKPKIPPTSLDILKEGLEMYGIKAFPVKDIIKALPAVFNGTNSAARDSAMALTVEIYRWIRLPPLQGMLDGLRTAQKSDFEKIIGEKNEEFTSTPAVPSLYLRKERPSASALAAAAAAAASNASAASAAVASAAGAAAAGGDAREYVDEVDLMKKLKATEFSTLVADEKWSEQLKGLQIVIDAIGPVPKIKAGNDVHDVVSIIKGFLRQGHLQLQISSLKILCLLADGLRGAFGSTLRPIMQQIVGKCKEKRLVPEVQAVLQLAFAHCLSYDCINDDVIEFVGSKKSPPHGKVCYFELPVPLLTNKAFVQRYAANTSSCAVLRVLFVIVNN